MKRWSIAIVAWFLLQTALYARAADREGSTPEDLAAKNPPHPNEVYVAALPFWASEESHRDLAQTCVMLNALRHGFKLAPSGSRSLAVAARRTETAVKRDGKVEPLARLEPKDVARIGGKLGAQWAIYGEVGDLHSESQGGALARKKTGTIDLRFFLVDVKSGEVLYWTHIQDSGQGSNRLFPAKASAVERKLLTQTLNAIFDDISEALPEHYISAEVTDEMVREAAESFKR